MAALSPEVCGGALALARLAGLASAAPLWSEGAVPARVRFAVVVLAAALVAPVSAAPALTMPELLALAALELAWGVVVATSARMVLAAVEIGAHLVAQSLGLQFAGQYDAQGTSEDPMLALGRAVAGLAFVTAGGLQAVVAAATRSPATDWLSASGALAPSAARALHAAESAAGHGLALAAPVMVAALASNLALALAQRAVASAQIIAIGFTATLLFGGGAALATSTDFVAGAEALAALATRVLLEAP